MGSVSSGSYDSGLVNTELNEYPISKMRFSPFGCYCLPWLGWDMGWTFRTDSLHSETRVDDVVSSSRPKRVSLFVRNSCLKVSRGVLLTEINLVSHSFRFRFPWQLLVSLKPPFINSFSTIQVIFLFDLICVRSPNLFLTVFFSFDSPWDEVNLVRGF